MPSSASSLGCPTSSWHTAILNPLGRCRSRSHSACECLVWIGLVVCFATGVLGQEEKPRGRAAGGGRPVPVEPSVALANDEGQSQIGLIQKPEGWQCELFAAEPLVANPVAMALDRQGRIYVCESFRQNQGVTDNRGHDRAWLMADLQAQTVSDRIAYHRRLLGGEAVQYEKQIDRLRIVSDQDGDGRADQSTSFVSGFNSIEEGTGASVLVRDQAVYYTCIPRLWRFRDQDGDGVADSEHVLADGFGVRVAFRGHDMHGLILGPDGRLYFSIGDRGYHVNTPRGLLADAESGAVFRCELDGSHLEVVATGLRNPQELAFDDYGNWFTCDNNSDSGDEARWTMIVPGGDSGWRMIYQYLPDRGPFNRENLWHPFNPDSPAYIIPPIANFADGPSGLVHYPGTGLDESYRHSFLLCDFRGQTSNSGIRRIKLKPRGAFFEKTFDDQPIWNLLATDLEFSSDGGLYVADWVNGWNGEGKGRIYRFSDPQAKVSPAVQETHAILSRGMGDRSSTELVAWLGHVDQRVRLEAQWELASRSAASSLEAVVGDRQASELARIHAVWGLGQIARRSIDPQPALDAIRHYLLRPRFREEAPSEVFAALLNAWSEAGIERLAGLPGEEEVRRRIVAAILDKEPRVRFAAAMSASRLRLAEGSTAAIEMLVDNADQDPILRHAGIMVLSSLGSTEIVPQLTNHPSESVRLAAVVALRKNQSQRVADFVSDPSPRVALEAARAVHDLPSLHAQLPRLASQLDRVTENQAFLHRCLNACFRLGRADDARAIAGFAADPQRPIEMRLEGLKMLQIWEKPGELDRVMNRYLPLEDRSPADAAAALRAVIAPLMKAEAEVRERARRAAADLGLIEVIPELVKLIDDQHAPGGERGEAIEHLAKLKYPELPSLTRKLVDDPAPLVRMAATKILSVIDPAATVEAVRRRVSSEVVAGRQHAWDLLVAIDHPAADQMIREGITRYLEGRLPQDCWLNVKAARRDRLPTELQQQLEKHEADLLAKSVEDPTAPFKDCEVGGDPKEGRKIFFERTQLSCLRCHEVGSDGGDVGPKLTDIGSKKKPDYLLEAIVAPNAKLAEGFESLLVQTVDGEVFSGIVKLQDAKKITLMQADGFQVTVDRDDIEATKRGPSSMPGDLTKFMTKRELRDLVAYLASLDGSANQGQSAKKPKGGKSNH